MTESEKSERMISIKKGRKCMIYKNSFFLKKILTSFMSKIYIGISKRGDAGVEAAMSGTIFMFTSLVRSGSVFPAGGTSYNM